MQYTYACVLVAFSGATNQYSITFISEYFFDENAILIISNQNNLTKQSYEDNTLKSYLV